MARITDPDSLRKMDEGISKEGEQCKAKKPVPKKPCIKRTPFEPDQLLPLPIEKLDLSEGTEKCLLNAGITTMGDLFGAGERAGNLLGIGRLGEVKEALGDIDPSLRIFVKGDFENTPVDHLELSARTIRGLWRENIRTVGELALRTEEDLLRIKGVGPGTVREIKRLLAGIGMALKT